MKHQLQAIKDPADWTGRQLASADTWNYTLDTDEIDGLLQLARTTVPSLECNPNKLLEMHRGQYELGPFASSIECQTIRMAI